MVEGLLADKSHDVLVLAPHTDDAELGMGGTIHRFHRSNIHVTQVAFSTAHKIEEHGGRNPVLEEEVKLASEATGATSLFLHDF